MQNKRRFVVFGIFVLIMFFLITFAGGPNNNGIATRTVEFIDGFDNETISLQKVEVGKDAEVPEDPKHKNYVFAGWFLFDDHDTKVTDFTEIMKDLKVIALYAGDLNNNGIADEDEELYTVTFRDSLTNAIIKQEEVLPGLDATAPQAPVHNGYTFTGWSRGYTNIQSNITVNAQYAVIPATTYQVTFVDGDTDETIEVQTIEEGNAATLPEAPVHEDRVFDHWVGEYENINSDRTITAVYKDDKNNDGIADDTQPHYTVKYVDYDDTDIEVFEDVLVDLETPTIEEPTREFYEFAGWDPEVAETVTDNATYKATYEPINDVDGDGIADEEENKYTVKYFVDGEEYEVYENLVDGIETPVPANPDKEYAVFGGWDPEVAETVTKDVTYTATWKEDKDNDNVADETENKYTVIYDVDGKETKFENLVEGITTPTIEAPDKEYAVFGGWNPEVAETVTASVTYKVVWLEDADNDNIADETENKYTVTFKDGDKTLATHENLVDGIATPAAPEVADKDYAVFGGWNPEIAETVTKTIAYEVVWLEDADNDNNPDKDEKKFTVIYKDGEEVLATHENLVDGIATPAAPEVADKDYAVFGGWNPEVAETVTASVTYEVVWLEDADNDNNPDKDEKKFTVIYKDGEEVLATHENLVDGIATPAAPEVADKEYAVFGGWDPEIAETVTKTVAYKVVWLEDKDNDNIADETENKYTVTYKDGDKTLATHENLVDGIATPAAPEVADKEYAVFGGWNPEVAATVKANATYVVVWLEDKDNDNIADETENKYTVTFKDGDKTLATHENLVDGIATPKAPEVADKEYAVFGGWDPEVTATVKADATYVVVWLEDKDNDNIADETENKYTVTFKDGDKTLATHENLVDGIATPAAPEVADKEYAVFGGWNPEVAATVKANATYVVVWLEDKDNDNIADETENKYTVTFKDGDKTLATHENLVDGIATPKAPEVADKDYAVFGGWDPEITATVTKTIAYEVVWLEDKDNDNIADETENKYTVTYKDGDKTLATHENLVDGIATPKAPEVADKDYAVFGGWNPEIAETVTKTVVYEVVWLEDKDNDNIADETENKYTITYKDGEEVLATHENLVDGIATPAAPEVADKDYAVFGGWNPEVAETVTASVTYEVVWLEDADNDNNPDKDEKKFTVIYKDGEEVLATHENLVDGIATPAAPEVADKDYAVFGGWNPEIAETVTKTVAYEVVWLEDKDNDNIADETENKYTVTFKDGDKTLATHENLVDGIATPKAPEVADKDYAVFGGWNPEVTATVKADATYVVVWLEDKDNDNIADETENKYTVTFKDGDKTLATHENLVDGIATPAAPEVADKEYAVFGGWNPEVAATVKADATYVVVWLEDKDNDNIADETENKYTVTFKDGDKTLATHENLVDGIATPAAPEVADKEYAVFGGWNPEIAETVTKTIAYEVVWLEDKDNDNIADETENKYTVTFKDGDKTLATHENLVDGIATPAAPEVADKDYAVFGGWNPEVAETVTASVTYEVVWLEDADNDNNPDKDEKKFTVIYKDGEEVLATHENLVDGIATPAAPEVADKEYAVFGGWNPEVAETVTASVTYEVVWLEDADNDNIADETENKYTVIYKDGETVLATHENLVDGIATPAAPEVEDKDYAVFGGWNPEVTSTVTKTVAYEVVWLEDKDNDNIADETENKYTVIYDVDGKETKFENLVEGITTPTIEDPDKEYAVFGGWNPEVAEKVTASVTYKAVWLEDADNDNIADETENKYTVTYKDGDKTLATHENLVDGIATPKAPEVADKDYAVFGGWNPEIAETVTKTIAYEVVWLEDADNDNNPDKDEKKFTVIYKDGEEVLATHENLVDGIATPAAPEVADKEYAVFGGWNPEVAETVTASVTYEVVWLEDADNDNNPDKDEKKFTVIYKDGETVLATHENLVDGIATPKAPEVADKDYAVFGGWDPEIAETVTKTVAYEVVWLEDKDNDNIADETENKYTVTFKDGDKTLATHENLVDGIATPAAPKVADKEYAVFGGWDPEITATVTKTVTYEVVWLEDKDNDNIADETENKYTVTFKDGDKTLATHENLVDGIATPAAPEVADKDYAVFGGWNPEVAATVKADATYVVVWHTDENNDNIVDSEQKRIIFKNYDGTELFNDLVTIGENIEDYIPEVPTREYYRFSGWNPKAEGTVTEDKTYTATYAPLNDTNGDGIADEEQRRVIFKNYNGDELLNKLVTIGETTPVPETPVRNQYYEFTGWNPEVAATVTADATYTATYRPFNDINGDGIADEEQTLWKVRFYGFGGALLLNEQWVVDGNAAIAPTAPTVSGYRFDGWLQDFSNVTADLDVIANYTDIEAPYVNPLVTAYDNQTKANIKVTVTDNVEVVEVRYAVGNQTLSAYEGATVLNSESNVYEVNGIEENGVYTFFAKDAAGNIAVVPVEVSVIEAGAGTLVGVGGTTTMGSLSGFIIGDDYKRDINVTANEGYTIADARVYHSEATWGIFGTRYASIEEFRNDSTFGDSLMEYVSDDKKSLNYTMTSPTSDRYTIYIKYAYKVETAPGVWEIRYTDTIFTTRLAQLIGD